MGSGGRDSPAIGTKRLSAIQDAAKKPGQGAEKPGQEKSKPEREGILYAQNGNG
jgi:hypothetical protein